ncbi:MAG TPA: hypothetical protein VK961_21560 [Chthoniobacter sp.]|nr:hypothetical protein [Chthoniobacter sp.]
MLTMPPTLTYLAMVIDVREERLEKTTIPFLKKQLQVELDRLFSRFETEYQNYLTTSGQTDPAEFLRAAA